MLRKSIDNSVANNVQYKQKMNEICDEQRYKTINLERDGRCHQFT